MRRLTEVAIANSIDGRVRPNDASTEATLVKLTRFFIDDYISCSFGRSLIAAPVHSGLHIAAMHRILASLHRCKERCIGGTNGVQSRGCIAPRRAEGRRL